MGLDWTCNLVGRRPSYRDAVEALFALAYALKFAVKKGSPAIDYGVMPLEGLWWADDMSGFTTGDRSAWKWTMIIMQPDFITPDMVDETTADVLKKKNPIALPLVRFGATSTKQTRRTGRPSSDNR